MENVTQEAPKLNWEDGTYDELEAELARVQAELDKPVYLTSETVVDVVFTDAGRVAVGTHKQRMLKAQDKTGPFKLGPAQAKMPFAVLHAAIAGNPWDAVIASAAILPAEVAQ